MHQVFYELDTHLCVTFPPDVSPFAALLQTNTTMPIKIPADDISSDGRKDMRDRRWKIALDSMRHHIANVRQVIFSWSSSFWYKILLNIFVLLVSSREPKTILGCQIFLLTKLIACCNVACRCMINLWHFRERSFSKDCHIRNAFSVSPQDHRHRILVVLQDSEAVSWR